MAKILIILITVFSIAAANANGENFFANDGLLANTNLVCSSDKVLNCNQGADGHHVYEVEETCPIGGEKFKAFQLGTHSTFGRHLDWEPVSYMRFPVPLPVCPANGFVITKEKYGKEELERLKKVIESKSYRDLYAEKHATFYLFGKINEALGERSNDLWWLYLNATWEADLCKNEERYKEYALAVVSAAEKRLAELKDSEQEYWVLKIITANMHRRIGDFETAQKLMDKFGTPALKEEGSNEFFALAIKLLKKAVKEKNTDRVPIREEKESDS